MSRLVEESLDIRARDKIFQSNGLLEIKTSVPPFRSVRIYRSETRLGLSWSGGSEVEEWSNADLFKDLVAMPTKVRFY